jgi:receptor protein-tyrosine kinase
LEDSVSRDEWSLADCLRILYRRKAALAGLASLGILAAAAVTVVQPRVYEARAAIEVQPFNESFLDLRDIYPEAASSVDAPTYLQTQMELLQQDSLLEQVAGKARLRERPEYQNSKDLVARLRQDIRIVPVRNSRVVEVVAGARSARQAADLANLLADTFIEQGIRDRQASAWQTYQALVPQVDELRRALHAPAAGKSVSPVEDVNRHVYDAVAQKAYRAQLASGLRITNLRLVSPATPPRIPARPNVPLNLAIGALGGLLLAVACVMLQEQRKLVLRAPGDARSYLALPELGAIPQASNWGPASIIFRGSSSGKLSVERAALEERPGLSESFRTTLASILAAGRNGGHPRVLLVTSSQPREGKTTIVSNLGIALAAISNKVLLIDGDMRRPRLHKLFDEANSWGLSDVLREKNAVDELPLEVLAKKTSVPHLYLLPSGASTDNIFGLLHSGRMSRLFPLFREEFDYVLVDAPPCLEFADARIMGRYAEELLLVVRANYTDRRTVQTAVDRLRFDGVPLMGVILNRWDPAPGDPYAYRAWRPVDRQVVA